MATNLTVLTNRRHYQFDYTAVAASGPRGSGRHLRVTFHLSAERRAAAAERRPSGSIRAQRRLGQAAAEHRLLVLRQSDAQARSPPRTTACTRACDSPRMRTCPAIFVRNDDGSESLLNFSMDAGDVIVHRVARQFILRRGKLTGCVVNQGFTGGGAAAGFRHRHARRRAHGCREPCHERRGPGPEQVRGEARRPPSIALGLVQSRISSLLAVSLMSVLGLGALTWYYAHHASRQAARSGSNTQSASANRAKARWRCRASGGSIRRRRRRSLARLSPCRQSTRRR